MEFSGLNKFRKTTIRVRCVTLLFQNKQWWFLDSGDEQNDIKKMFSGSAAGPFYQPASDLSL